MNVIFRFGVFEKENPGDENSIEIIPLKTPPFRIKSDTNLKRVLSESIMYLDENISKLNLFGSGWQLTAILKVDLSISR